MKAMNQKKFDSVKSVLESYGGSLSPDQHIIAPDGDVTTACVNFAKGRLQIRGASGYCLFSGAGAKSVARFAEKFWR